MWWAAHLGAARAGNNNPTGVDVKSKADTVPFHPYYTVKDGFAIAAFFILFAWFVFFAPEALGHVDNQTPANPLVTPSHIVPEWYFLPFYAILRSIPQKLFGVLAMFGSIGMLFVLRGWTPPRCAPCATARRRGSSSCCSCWPPSGSAGAAARSRRIW